MRLHRRSEADTTGSVRFEVLTCGGGTPVGPRVSSFPHGCSRQRAVRPAASSTRRWPRRLRGPWMVGGWGSRGRGRPADRRTFTDTLLQEQRDEPCALRPDAPAHAAPPSTPLTPLTPLRRVLATRARPLCRVGAAPWPSTGAQRPLTLPVLSDVARAKGSALQTGGTSSPEEGPCASGHRRPSGRRAELSSPPPSVGRAVLQPSRGTFSGSGKCVSVKSDFERC